MYSWFNPCRAVARRCSVAAAIQRFDADPVERCPPSELCAVQRRRCRSRWARQRSHYAWQRRPRRALHRADEGGAAAVLHCWGESVQHLRFVAEVDMLRSARLFLCVRCCAQVLLCSHCDHGQVYCTRACSFAARRERRRHTAKRYQDSRCGRLKHAARTASWRKRRRSLRQAGAAIDIDKVTHQGCPHALADASLLACDTTHVGEPITRDALSDPVEHVEPASLTTTAFAAALCRRCAHSLLPHVRMGWLRRNRGGIRRLGHHDHPS